MLNPYAVERIARERNEEARAFAARQALVRQAEAGRRVRRLGRLGRWLRGIRLTPGSVDPGAQARRVQEGNLLPAQLK